jgi:hypothetical protein
MELLANFCYLNHSGVCSISEDFKEARPHYGVPHTTEVLLANTESHGLCSVRVRCERGRRVLSFLAEQNSRPKNEILILPSRSLVQGRTKPASLGTCERSRGEGVREQPLSSARDGPELLGTVLPETRQVEGLAAEALSGSPAGVSVRTPAGHAELTSTCPATHAGWWMDDGLWIENHFSVIFQSHS